MLVGNLTSVILNILIVKILTNKFSIAEFGIYSLIVAFSTFPQLVLFAPISAAIFPFINRKKENNLYNDFQKDMFNLFFLIGFVLLIILLMVTGLTIYGNGLSPELLAILASSFLFSVTLSWLTMLDTFSLANHKVKEFTVFPTVNLLSKFVALIGIMFCKTHVVPAAVILVFCLIQTVLCGAEFFYLRRKKILDYKITFSFKEIVQIKTASKQEVLKYAQNFFLWGIFGWGQSFFDKWFLNYYNGSSSVAIYAVYYQYGFFPFTIFSSIISQYITPLFFSKISRNEEALSFLKRLLNYCVLGLLIFSGVLIILAYYIAPFFIKIFTNARYLESIHLFPIIVLAGIFFGFGQIITVPLLNSDFVKKIRLPKISSAILSVTLFGLLVPRYGLTGILIALLLSNMVYFVSLLVINYNYAGTLASNVN